MSDCNKENEIIDASISVEITDIHINNFVESFVIDIFLTLPPPFGRITIKGIEIKEFGNGSFHIKGNDHFLFQSINLRILFFQKIEDAVKKIPWVHHFFSTKRLSDEL